MNLMQSDKGDGEKDDDAAATEGKDKDDAAATNGKDKDAAAANEGKDKDGDKKDEKKDARKDIAARSDVWQYFEKIKVDGILRRGKCNYCSTEILAHPVHNGEPGEE
ncbi:uncharacterized protein LOC104584746 [Brachypodium distachyon]|uniref:uncharacterized protein LOC104584746 n=1 Tax=Brachypodium distachyon TaxID=15368 RepID=UPI00052FE052|nr:uncharacterized protein LOC104584746 [Brachypodium distachyon]|eukprot:XP_010238582.1 uncharacterized protein LOC104584746 [Brachypodium distachyon]